MSTIALGYGSEQIEFEYDSTRFHVLAPQPHASQPLTDVEINSALDAPIGSPPLEDLIVAGDTVLIVVSDATRATGSAQVVNLLVRRLIENGISAREIAIIFATGIHRAVRPAEKIQLLTAFIAQRIHSIDHNPYDASQLVQIGVMPNGKPLEVNRALKEFSKIIVTGSVGFHYFAGFTGGRKSICPGLASAETIEQTHMLAMDFEHGGRRAGVGTGLLEGNAVSEACEQVTALIDPAFSVNSVVNGNGRVDRIFAGHWRAAHRRACAEYLGSHSQEIFAPRDLVVVSCGGAPHDINLIQAHKALDMAAHACNDGGTIVLLAECTDGLGRDDFLKWFTAENSHALEDRLRTHYEVNGQTAWALMTKAERYRVLITTKLPPEHVRKMRMTPARSLDDALTIASPFNSAYILPRGAALLPVLRG